MPFPFLRRRLTARLTQITRSIRRLAEGDLAVRVEIQGKDEAGQLEEAFNLMAARLEAQIQEQEAARSQMESVLQSMKEGVMAIGPEGDLLLANRAARQILGVGQGTLLGHPFAEIIRQQDLHELVGRVLKEGQPQSRELAWYAPSEQILQVHGVACRFVPQGGGAEGRGVASSSDSRCALLVIHDVTELKRLEQVRHEFVANVSHELKTPLTAIQGAVETLLDGALGEPDHGRAFVESILEETGRLTRMVEDLLTLAQVESKGKVLAKEPISIGAFLQEQIARHQASAKADQVSIELEPVPAEQTLWADKNLLAQAVGNLLDNAIKYNKAGGRVTIRVSIEGRICRVEVEDTGIGIPSENLPRIFERFYRVDKARSRETGGTGLGLSIVKHVAEAHGGSVQLESRLHQGSRFTLILPA